MFCAFANPRFSISRNRIQISRHDKRGEKYVNQGIFGFCYQPKRLYLHKTLPDRANPKGIGMSFEVLFHALLLSDTSRCMENDLLRIGLSPILKSRFAPIFMLLSFL